jgi:hypothetical protein
MTVDGLANKRQSPCSKTKTFVKRLSSVPQQARNNRTIKAGLAAVHLEGNKGFVRLLLHEGF